MRKMINSTWQKMKTNHVMSGLAITITGIIVTAFLWWFLRGFSFLGLPGFAILFIGIAELLHTIYLTTTEKTSTLLRAGLLTLFIGVAGYLSFASHVMLGTLQITSLAVIVIGIVLLVAGILRKT
jgi:hypothetical protein